MTCPYLLNSDYIFFIKRCFGKRGVTAAILDYASVAPPRPVPPYEEVIVEQQWARHPPDPYQIINNIRARVDSAMGHPDVFGNPEVLRIMQGIQSEWSMMEQMAPPRRRSRSPQD